MPKHTPLRSCCKLVLGRGSDGMHLCSHRNEVIHADLHCEIIVRVGVLVLDHAPGSHLLGWPRAWLQHLAERPAPGRQGPSSGVLLGGTAEAGAQSQVRCAAGQMLTLRMLEWGKSS